jgi:hypothetical protein
MKGENMKAGAFASVMMLVMLGCGSGMPAGGGGGGGGSGGGTTMTSSSQKIEQINGQCPTNPSVLTGGAGSGASCAQATDCKPTCCQCGNGKSNAWLGAECSNGACADPCADTVSDADCSN